jgi:hypothetical protein
MRRGTTAQRAGNLAAMFSDQESNYPRERHSNSNDARRRPGHLFTSGATILVANKDGRFDSIIAAVVNAPLAEVVGRYKSEAVVVDVEGVVNRVLACLPLTRQRTLPVTEPATLHCPQRELGSPAVT